MSAAAIGPSQIGSATVDDVDLVVWRDHTGVPTIMEARCPHQWSHLEAEGVVDGDEIVCTAHFWRFDRDGHGTKLNVLGRRDEKADITTFACREHDGRIQVWFEDTSDAEDVTAVSAGATRADLPDGSP
jgi:phenylpropionate dioxygenase-like ring-hydroxylating dioxygenase large terminal subunit